MNRSVTPTNQRTNNTNPPNIKEQRKQRSRPGFLDNTSGQIVQNLEIQALVHSMNKMNIGRTPR